MIWLYGTIASIIAGIAVLFIRDGFDKLSGEQGDEDDRGYLFVMVGFIIMGLLPGFLRLMINC